ncbi:hypothetical protein EDD37DRAFT_608980 [Exophiala viscosa]|uniref:uncharacterized protein n=1 Tax=Exophiala viscosa TaxID=2486360 RepID=UPI00218E5907|nr:hypothetical protein EDD37DRAFT_608980 [Exophiala viscosa]
MSNQGSSPHLVKAYRLWTAAEKPLCRVTKLSRNSSSVTVRQPKARLPTVHQRYFAVTVAVFLISTSNIISMQHASFHPLDIYGRLTSTIMRLESLSDTIEEHNAPDSVEQIKVDDFLLDVRSWAADARVDDGSFSALESVPLCEKIMSALSEIRDGTHTLQDQVMHGSLLREDPWVDMQDACQTLRSTVKAIRLAQASADGKGPYADLRDRVSRVREMVAKNIGRRLGHDMQRSFQFDTSPKSRNERIKSWNFDFDDLERDEPEDLDMSSNPPPPISTPKMPKIVGSSSEQTKGKSAAGFGTPSPGIEEDAPRPPSFVLPQRQRKP